MSSELPILNAWQKEKFLEIWNRKGLSPRGVILLMLMSAVVRDGGPSESELFNRAVVDHKGSVTVPGTKYRANWPLKDVLAIDTHFTFVVGTSWELTSVDKAALKREVAKQIFDVLLPRVKFSHVLCESPPR